MSGKSANSQFATTHWSLVLAAGKCGSDGARQALSVLCGAYWYPLYSFARRNGYDPHHASDLTQGFFAHILEREDLAAVDPARGRFRSWLLTSFRHFEINQWQKSRAQKRGGSHVILPIDALGAEQRYLLEPAEELTAERAFERRWALELLQRVMNCLRDEYQREGKVELYDALQDCLVDRPEGLPYREVGSRVGMTEGAVKGAAFRLRRRFRAEIWAAIAQTVERPEDVEDEIRLLFDALS
jgi:RNA polymerase sigma factor (sigma-70 family)